MQRKQSILDTNAQCFETFACSKSARVIEKGESRMETSRDCTVDGPEVPNPIRSTRGKNQQISIQSQNLVGDLILEDCGHDSQKCLLPFKVHYIFMKACLGTM